MAIGDEAQAAGLAIFRAEQDLRLGYENDNIRGDEIARVLRRVENETAPRVHATPPQWGTMPGFAGAEATRVGLVGIGDSKMGFNGNQGAPSGPGSFYAIEYGWGYLAQAMIRLRHRCTVAYKGIAGNHTSHMLARLDTDVLALKPRYVFVDGGTNDMRDGVPYVQIIANLQLMYERILATGATPIASTIMPAADATDDQKSIGNQVNSWLRTLARSLPGEIILADWAQLLTLGNGNPRPELFDAVGVHPNEAGSALLGEYLFGVLDPIIPKAEVLWSSGTKDASNLIQLNALLQGNNGSGFVPNGWTTGAASAAKVSRAPREDEWQQITTTPGTEQGINQYPWVGASIGAPMQGRIEFETDAAGWADGELTIRLMGLKTSGEKISEAYAVTSPAGRIPSGVLITPPFIVQPGTDSLTLSATKKGAGTVRWGRPEVRFLPL